MADRGPDHYFTPQELAHLLSVNRATVYSWIRSGQLKASKPGGRLLRISHEDLAAFLTPTEDHPSSPIMTRRRFNIMTGRSLVSFTASIAVSSVAGAVAGQGLEDLVYDTRRRRNAVERFREIFGFQDDSRLFDHFWGRPAYWDWYHPYNEVAGKKLQQVLGIDNEPIIASRTPLKFAPQRKGDILVVGGPNSNTETMVAWGFKGDDYRNLVPQSSPPVPLRWYSSSSELDEMAPTGYQIAYSMGSGRMAFTTNWPLYDRQKQEVQVPEPGNRVKTQDGNLYGPGQNFLILTRLANFLDPTFGAKVDIPNMPRHSWPTMLVIDGTHGPGTRGIELLLGDDGPDILEDIAHNLAGADSYQILLVLSGLVGAGGGLQRFKQVERVEVQPLHIDRATYRAAHDYAQRRLYELRLMAPEQ